MTEKRPYEEDTKGHVWKLNEDGEVDIWAYEQDGRHNGPVCEKCNYGFCHHCDAVPDEECKEPLRDRVRVWLQGVLGAAKPK